MNAHDSGDPIMSIWLGQISQQTSILDKVHLRAAGVFLFPQAMVYPAFSELHVQIVQPVAPGKGSIHRVTCDGQAEGGENRQPTAVPTR